MAVAYVSSFQPTVSADAAPTRVQQISEELQARRHLLTAEVQQLVDELVAIAMKRWGVEQRAVTEAEQGSTMPTAARVR